MQNTADWENNTTIVFPTVISDWYEGKTFDFRINIILSQMKIYSCLRALEVVMA